MNINETSAAKPGERRIVFLDFDGVLVNRRSLQANSGREACADSECVKVLNQITKETGAHIVVSSTWRIGMSIPELRELLSSWGVTAPVLARTPHMGFSVQRGSEIKAWMDMWEQSRDAIKSFVILDDDSDMGPLAGFLVQTTFDNGLEAKHAEQAIELLRGGGD